MNCVLYIVYNDDVNDDDDVLINNYPTNYTYYSTVALILSIHSSI
jgi:hypothetical protein